MIVSVPEMGESKFLIVLINALTDRLPRHRQPDDGQRQGRHRHRRIGVVGPATSRTSKEIKWPADMAWLVGRAQTNGARDTRPCTGGCRTSPGRSAGAHLGRAGTRRGPPCPLRVTMGRRRGSTRWRDRCDDWDRTRRAHAGQPAAADAPRAARALPPLASHPASPSIRRPSIRRWPLLSSGQPKPVRSGWSRKPRSPTAPTSTATKCGAQTLQILVQNYACGGLWWRSSGLAPTFKQTPSTRMPRSTAPGSRSPAATGTRFVFQKASSHPWKAYWSLTRCTTRTGLRAKSARPLCHRQSRTNVEELRQNHFHNDAASSV